MAVLPQSNVNLTDITVASQPSRTWFLNQKTGRIQGEIDTYAAVKQAVEIILNVERFRWQIFSPYSGMQWAGLIGRDPGYVAAELKRRISDALKMDDRVISVEDLDYTISGNTLTAELIVKTVYGTVENSVEVDVA